MIKPTLKFARVLVKSGPLTNTGTATWAALPGKPIEFKPEPHNHTLADVAGLPELAANVTLLEGNLSNLRALELATQSETACLTAQVLALRTATPSSHNHLTAQVTGLDSWMSTTDSAIAGIRSVLTSKSSTGHTHLAADITDLPTQLATKADRVHAHGIDDVTGLRAALANVTAGNHTHAINDVTGLQACLTGLAGDLTTVTRDLASKADNTRYATTARAGLVKVGRNLTVAADGTLDAQAATVAWGNITNPPATFTPSAHVHNIADVTGLQACLTTAATDIADLTAKIPTLALKVHNHPISDVVGLDAALGQITACFTRVDGALADKVDEAVANLRYASISHSHYITDVNGLRSELDNIQLTAQRGLYTLPPATGLTLGGIKVGQNLSVDACGTLSAVDSYVLPNATASVLGGVRAGASLVANNGTLDVDPSVYVAVLTKGTPNGVASLDGAGKVPASQISAVAISDTFVVADETARLALPSASRGDVAVQLDVQQTFILQDEPAANATNWVQLLNNVACVTSVNNMTGNVELFGHDITNNVWAINGLTGNVTLEGTDLANNVYSFNGRVGAVTLEGADLPLANLTTIGGVKPDGVSTFVDANGTLSAAGAALATANTVGVVKPGTGITVAGDGSISIVDYTDRIQSLEKTLGTLWDIVFQSSNPTKGSSITIWAGSVAGSTGRVERDDQLVMPWVNKVDPLFLFFNDATYQGPTTLLLRTNVDLSDDIRITAATGQWLMWNVSCLGGISSLVNKTGKRLTATTLTEFNAIAARNSNAKAYTIAELIGNFKHAYFIPDSGVTHIWPENKTWQRMCPYGEDAYITFEKV